MVSFMTSVLLGDIAGFSNLEYAVISARIQAVCVTVMDSLHYMFHVCIMLMESIKSSKYKVIGLIYLVKFSRGDWKTDFHRYNFNVSNQIEIPGTFILKANSEQMYSRWVWQSDDFFTDLAVSGLVTKFFTVKYYRTSFLGISGNALLQKLGKTFFKWQSIQGLALTAEGLHRSLTLWMTSKYL